MNRTEIVPFWNRLRDIALYPFRDGAKYTLIVMAGAITVLGWLPIIGPLLWIATFKYAFEILQASANGRLKSPEVVIGIGNAVVVRYIVLQVLTVAIPLLAAVALSPGLGLTLFVLFVLVQPAAIMGLAMTESLRRALNPGLWLAVMTRIGWPYLALFGLMLVIQLSAANASTLLASVLPGLVAHAVAVVFSIWSLFATFHLMGYLIFQYHEALGFEPRVFAEQAPLPFNRDRELLDLAGAKVRDGNPNAALHLLRDEINSRAVSVDVHELYRRLLQQGGDRAALIAHGRQFLHLLMIEKQERRALGLARECLDADPDFTALEVEHNAALAERAAFGGQSKLAVDLLLAVLRTQPQHGSAAHWALRCADLLVRQNGREAEARHVLQRAHEHCADADLRQRIDAQLAAIPA